MQFEGISAKKNTTLIPLASSLLPAGFPSPAADYIEDKIDLNDLLIKHPSATFMFRVQGDSMKDAFIPEKAILIVDRALTAKNNDIIVAAINGELTVKRLLTGNTGNWLKPENPKYQPLQITAASDFSVWGVVVKIIIDPRDI